MEENANMLAVCDMSFDADKSKCLFVDRRCSYRMVSAVITVCAVLQDCCKSRSNKYRN